MPAKKEAEVLNISANGRFSNPTSFSATPKGFGRPPLYGGGRAAAAKALAAVAAVSAASNVHLNKKSSAGKKSIHHDYVPVEKLEEGSGGDSYEEDEEIDDASRKSSRTVLAVAVGLTLLAILLVLQRVNTTDTSSGRKMTPSSEQGASSSPQKVNLKNKRAVVTDNDAEVVRAATSAAPVPAAPPILIGQTAIKNGAVWSKGSWMRFLVESRDTDITVGVPSGCVAYPSVSSLAAMCDLREIQTSQFPLKFSVEALTGIATHQAKCTVGCSKVALAAKDSLLTLSIDSVDDLTERCLSNKAACLLSFDFLVTYNKGLSTSPTAESDNNGADLPPVCFLSIGDWGEAVGVAKVARAMSTEAKNHFAKFIVSTGDNFYPTGVKSLADPHWENTFEKPFASPFVKNVRWFIAAGNHDQWGLAPQLQYGATHPRWYFPSPFYNDEVPLYESQRASFEGSEGGTQGSTTSTSMFLTVLDFNGRQKDKQIEFLNAMLRDRYPEIGGVSAAHNNNAFAGTNENKKNLKKFLWRAIVNHPLLFGGSSHGLDRETVYNRNVLKPTLDQYKVHFHLSGHDHILEILRSNHTDYFISGAGGGSAMYTSTHTEETIWWQGEGVRIRGFMRHCMFGHSHMETTLINEEGSVLFAHKTPFDN